MDRYADRQVDKYADRQVDKYANRQVDRYTDRQVCVCPCRHYPDEPPLYRDHYDGHAPYTNSSYGNGYNEARRTTRRRLLPATPTGKRTSSFLPEKL